MKVVAHTHSRGIKFTATMVPVYREGPAIRALADAPADTSKGFYDFVVFPDFIPLDVMGKTLKEATDKLLGQLGPTFCQSCSGRDPSFREEVKLNE